ncbi:Stigma-specific STIG1-like protein 3 [Linum grandiflorum]
MAILLLTTNVTPTASQVEANQPPSTSRFLLDQKTSSFSLAAAGDNWRRRKCDKFPTTCYLKGSPGPHCCNRKCVDVAKDRANCGKCGRRCGYGQICYGGKCVNPSFNRSNCGGCGNKCDAPVGGDRYKKHAFCAFGLCNYS